MPKAPNQPESQKPEAGQKAPEVSDVRGRLQALKASIEAGNSPENAEKIKNAEQALLTEFLKNIDPKTGKLSEKVIASLDPKDVEFLANKVNAVELKRQLFALSQAPNLPQAPGTKPASAADQITTKITTMIDAVTKDPNSPLAGVVNKLQGFGINSESIASFALSAITSVLEKFAAKIPAAAQAAADLNFTQLANAARKDESLSAADKKKIEESQTTYRKLYARFMAGKGERPDKDMLLGKDQTAVAASTPAQAPAAAPTAAPSAAPVVSGEKIVAGASREVKTADGKSVVKVTNTDNAKFTVQAGDKKAVIDKFKGDKVTEVQVAGADLLIRAGEKTYTLTPDELQKLVMGTVGTQAVLAKADKESEKKAIEVTTATA